MSISAKLLTTSTLLAPRYSLWCTPYKPVGCFCLQILHTLLLQQVPELMVCSNWHITPITQLLFCQCPTSLFNSLFVENGAIVYVMLSTTIVTVAFFGILSFILSRIWMVSEQQMTSSTSSLNSYYVYLCSPSRLLSKTVGHWLTLSLLLQNLSDLRNLVLIAGAFLA